MAPRACLRYENNNSIFTEKSERKKRSKTKIDFYFGRRQKFTLKQSFKVRGEMYNSFKTAPPSLDCRLQVNTSL